MNKGSGRREKGMEEFFSRRRGGKHFMANRASWLSRNTLVPGLRQGCEDKVTWPKTRVQREASHCMLQRMEPLRKPEEV